jgi:predicted PurR-regulated permease PerM
MTPPTDPPPPADNPPASDAPRSATDPALYTTAPFNIPGRPSGFRRFARLWGFAAFLVVVAYFFREALVPFIFAILIAYVLAPVVDRLARLRIGRHHLPRGIAVILCYIVVLTATAFFFIAFLPRLSSDFARLGKEAPHLWERAQKEWTPLAARWLEQHFPSLAPDVLDRPAPPPQANGVMTELPPPPGTVLTVTPMANGDYAITIPVNGLEIERLDDKHVVFHQREAKPQKRLEDLIRERLVRVLAGLEGQVAEVLKLGQAIVAGIVTLLIQFVIVLLVAAYMLVDIDRVNAFVRSVVPQRHRLEYDAVVRGVNRGLNGVIRGQLLVCLWNGALTYVGLLIFGVKYSLLLAVLAGVMSVVPIFGSIASSVPIVIFAVFGDDGVDLFRGLIMLIWIIGVHFTESSLVGPKIMGAQARMHPVLVIFALIAGEHTYGLVGAVLAVPVASIIQTLFMYFRSRAWRVDANTSIL